MLKLLRLEVEAVLLMGGQPLVVLQGGEEAEGKGALKLNHFRWF
jgi:hypothetical protein